MKILYLTPASLGYLAQLILALMITGYLAYRTAAARRRGTGGAHMPLLAAVFASVAGIVLLFFLDAALPPSARLYAVYLENTTIGLFLTLMTQFAYRFLRAYPQRKWEARIVLALNLGYTLWEAGFALYRGRLLLQHAYVLYRPLLSDYVLVACFGWVPLAFLRQAIAASQSESGQGRPGVLNLAGLCHLWRPQGRVARAARAFALVFLIPLFLSLVNIWRATFAVSPALFQSSMSAGILLVQFLFALVYLNAIPDMTSFPVRVVGVTLVMVLAVFGVAGWAMAPPHVAAYRPALVDGQTLRFTPNASGGYDVTPAEFHFDADMGKALDLEWSLPNAPTEAVADLAFTFPFYGQTAQTLWVMRSGVVGVGAPLRYPNMEYHYATTPAIFPLFTALAGGSVFAKHEGERLTITWYRLQASYDPQATFTFQLLLQRDGVFEITTNGLPNLAFDPNASPFTKVWVVGASPGRPDHLPQPVDFSQAPLQGGPQGMVQDYYLEFRRHLHQLLAPLAVLILASSVFVVAGLLLIFYFNLVKPLNALLDGVRRVETGDLDSVMPVLNADEIGFLTQAFNDMVGQLRELVTGLEARVAEQTQALRESARALASLIGNLPGMAYRCRPDGRRTMEFISEGCLDLTGYPPAAFIHNAELAYADVVHPDDRERIWNDVQASVQARQPYQLTYRILSRDGQEKWVWEQGQGVFDGQGQLLALEGLINDITERRRMEEDLQRAKALADEKSQAALEAQRAAEAASRAKSAFLANMSHELRTPLNAILGFSELMARDASLSPAQRQDLETINHSGEHLLALINDVLDLSKIEAGRVALQDEAFDLHRLLGDMESMFRLRAQNEGLSLNFDCAPAVPRYVRADHGKLRQVLINLLGNAIKFTEQGGVTLRVRQIERSDRDRDGSGSVSKASICFEIEDTGVGIRPEEVGRLFDAFEQAGAGRRLQEGTGLGLAISRQFVRLMGGDISASSAGVPGQGSRFTFELRVGLPDPAEIASLPSKSVRRRVVGLAEGQPAYRVLVVEDVPASRRLVVEMLRPLGLDVREAANGQEAVDAWQAWRPELILMDLRMPVLDGHEATRRIKAAAQGEQVIIVALTASAFEEDRAKVLAEGFDDFIRKPAREADILAMLEKHLGARFAYGTESLESGPPQDLSEEMVESLAAMPPAWLATFRQAALEGDWSMMTDLLDQVERTDPALESLLRLVDNFQYEELLSLLRQAMA